MKNGQFSLISALLLMLMQNVRDLRKGKMADRRVI